MKLRVWGLGALVALGSLMTGSAQAQSNNDSLVVVEAFANQHIRLDWDGIQPPWLGRKAVDQRINWSMDSLGILYSGIQNEWQPTFLGQTGGVVLYQIQAGDTAGIPIAFDFDTYRMIKMEQNTLADWQSSVQSQLRLRDSEKARDLVAISLPFKLPKAVTSIVGEGGAGLKVNGFKRINFSGRSQWRDGPNVSSAQAQSKFPSLDMEQITQMTITGKIGSKIEVKVDQDSRRVTDLGNRIQIRYNGYEDEIIQTIEAGNTNLSLPNTQFVGYSQRVQGLFGVKATAKVGNLSLTAIASQEKGSTEGASFTAGAKGDESFIRDDQYLRYRYFWLLNPYTDSVWAQRFANGDSIITFRLYRTANFEDLDVEPSALIMPDSLEGITIDSARNTDTIFHSRQRRKNVSEIEATDYLVDRRQFWVTLSDNNPVSDAQILGYYAEIQTPFGIDTIGAIADSSYDSLTTKVSLILTMLKPDDELRPSHPSWLLEWKNVYDLGVRDITADGLKVDVYQGGRGTETQTGQNVNNVDGTRFMEIMGLDRFATDGSPVPDGLIDDNNAILDRGRGHLIFPNSFPFAPSFYPVQNAGLGPTDSLPYPSNLSPPIFGERRTYALDGTFLESETPNIYAGELAENRQEASEYYMTVTTTERRTSYSLGRVNIIEGSEVVKLNGRQLTRGVDYSISYEIGQINFLSEEVLDPNANVTVDYEYEPFFSVDRKSLLGVRGEYRPSNNFHWGVTALFKSEQQPDNQKPRLGEEPGRTLVYDTDIGFRTSANFLTKITDALPLIEASAPSNLDVQAEFAQSLPNPNTLGEVYIDDFEASRESISLPLFREAWTQSSPPVGRLLSDRGKGIWYNRFDPYRITEIYNKEEQPAEDRTQVLTLKMEDSQGPQQWGGIMRSVSTGLRSLTNTQFIEFRIQGNEGKLLFAMGEISEDVNQNTVLDTEDKVRDNYQNGILDEDEDTGLDGLFNPDEPGYDPVTNPDPNGDDWFYDDSNTEDYSRINGTEGNRPDPLRGWVPDTEDANNNNSLDPANNYFEYEIDLSDPNDPFLVQNSEFCNECSDGGTLGPWRTFRIPISDTTLPIPRNIVGSPRLSEIEFMRLGVTGVDSGDARINIADMSLVSFRWRDIRIETDRDSAQAMLVSVVNTRENSDYTSPPGVEEVIDRVTLIGQGEQSLLVGFSNLQPRIPDGDTTVIIDSTQFDTAGIRIYDTTQVIGDRLDLAIVSQRLLSNQDYTGYRNLEMYVHGDDTSSGEYVFFFRFGSDTANFYEYRSFVIPGWAESNYVNVDFNDLTGLKFDVQQNIPSSEFKSVDTTVNPYRIRGNPSLSRISYLEMGVANLDTTRARGGRIWVNELRLTNVRKDAGWAGRFALSGNFSDFGSFGVSYRAQNYAFKSLTSSRQNVVNSSSAEDLSINARFSPMKALPPSVPLQMPVSLTWSKSKSTPYFKTQSDIVVPEDAREEEATTTENKGLSIALRYQKPQGGNFVERYFLNPFNASLAYSESESSSPVTNTAVSKSYRGQARYNVSIARPPGIPFLYWTRLFFLPKSIYNSKLTFMPSKFNATGNYTERTSFTQYVVNGPITESFARDFTGNFSLGWAPITNFTFDYTYNTTRDLRDPNTVNLVFSPSEFQLGVETNFNQSYRTSYINRWIWFLEQRYNYDVSYVENLERQSSNLNARNLRTLTSGRTFQASYGLSWVRLFGAQNPNDRWFTFKLYQPVRKLVRGVLGRLDNLSVSYGNSKQIRGFGYTERPSWDFVWGLTDQVDSRIQSGVTEGTNRNSDGVTVSRSARSGLNILGSRITLSYSWREQRSNNTANRSKTQTETFPSARITFSQLSNLGIIKKLMNSATMEFAYDEKNDFQLNESLGDTTSASKDIRFTPLLGLSMNWRGNVSTQVKIDHTQRTARSPSSATNSRSRGSDDAITFSLRYSFSAPGGIKLPFLSGIRLSSTMNLSVSASWSKSKQEQSVSGGPFQLTSERTTLSIAPQAGYSFSQTLTGGFRARWQDTNDKVQQSNTHVRELGFWVEFRF
jgi:hypothetical protein